MKKRNWFWGIFFILATILLIASQVGSFTQIGFWSLLATILLVAIIIQSIVKRAFFGIFLPVALLYLIYQTPFGWIYLSPWILIIGAIMLSIGFQLLFKSRSKHCYEDSRNHSSGQTFQSQSEENFPKINVKFGNVIRYLNSDCLSGGEFTTSFGNLEVYFDKATLSPEGAELFLDCNFGSISLYVPRHWSVVDQTNGSMGGVSFKNEPSPAEGQQPVLTLKGDINMASVEVRFI